MKGLDLDFAGMLQNINQVTSDAMAKIEEMRLSGQDVATHDQLFSEIEKAKSKMSSVLSELNKNKGND